jgi:hypothetical protein
VLDVNKLDGGVRRAPLLTYTMATTTMIKILYNDCYGGFNLSDAFVAEYEKRTGKKFNDTRYYGTGPNSIRVDPVALAIFVERGSEWCSGVHAILAVRTVPATLAQYWEIEEYDGSEHVRVHVPWALADVLETYIQTGDHGAMLDQYRRIKAAEQQLKRTTLEDD